MLALFDTLAKGTHCHSCRPGAEAAGEFWIRLLIAALIMLPLMSCARVGPLGRPGAPGWSQFHADGPNQGALFVGTDFALAPAWDFDVGPVYFGSPVIGPDGTVYVGNLDGDVIAVNPNGTQKWRVTTPFRILSTAAVAENGTVYAVATSFFPDAQFIEDKFRSSLMTIDPDGTVLRHTLIPDGFTASSPKAWFSGRETYVFLFANIRRESLTKPTSALFVFDGDGALIARKDLGCTQPLVGVGPSIGDLLEAFFELFTIEFDPSGGAVEPPPDFYGWIEPTVTVIDRGDLVEDGSALLVIPDQVCSDVWAVRWTPPDLETIWSVDEEDEKLRYRSSLTFVDSSTSVVGGRDDGKVVAYDAVSGDEMWTYDAKEQVLATPATFGALVYITSVRQFHVLDQANGERLHQRDLPAVTSASPGLSANKLLISHKGGVHTRTLDLATFANDGSAPFAHQASPAIAEDGTIYVIHGARPHYDAGETAVLRAYPLL